MARRRKNSRRDTEVRVARREREAEQRESRLTLSAAWLLFLMFLIATLIYTLVDWNRTRHLHLHSGLALLDFSAGFVALLVTITQRK